MPSILNLKFKGNKSFVAFSNLNDAESLTKTWKVCTKVASYLEQGQRLENLSWRLWHLQNLMVDNDNAKTKREFKKLSKCMGDKLDKEKGRNITELEAPDFKRNHSTDIIQQRAAEKERLREATQNGTIQRMQFTFSIDQPAPSLNTLPVKKPDLKPSPEFTKRGRIMDESFTQRGRKSNPSSLHFPPLFSTDFGPSALLYAAPSVSTSMNYGEGLSLNVSNDFSIVRPTIELPLDELLDAPEMTTATSVSQDVVMHILPDASSSSSADSGSNYSDDEGSDNDLISTSTLGTVPPISLPKRTKPTQKSTPTSLYGAKRSATPTRTSSRPALSLRTQLLAAKPTGPGATPTLNVNNNNSNTNRIGTSVTPTANLGSSAAAANGGSAPPGGVKAECSNCGATHTPLWRRGLNDELNCNACGLYCKLHKRPRPKSMRNTQTERTGGNSTPRQDPIEVAAQCYNCQTTTTPLWRKDDDGRTVCNACGLYYKLHGSARPISMKSDIIRKRSRHEARRAAAAAAAAANSNGGGGSSPSHTPDSRSSSPGAELGLGGTFPTESDLESSPTFAPDSSTAASVYEYHPHHHHHHHHHNEEDMTFQYTQSELMSALGGANSGGSQSVYMGGGVQFPGPFSVEHLTQLFSSPLDALPFATADLDSDFATAATPSLTTATLGGLDTATSPRSKKRRRLSSDSTSEPPSSAVSLSFSSFTSEGGYSSTGATSPTTSTSQRSSIDFSSSAFAGCYPSGPTTTTTATSTTNSPHYTSVGSFWHPPLMVKSSMLEFHPPMYPPPSSLSAEDYFHSLTATSQEDEQLFSTYLHPPMSLTEDEGLKKGVKDEDEAMEGVHSYEGYW